MTTILPTRARDDHGSAETQVSGWTNHGISCSARLTSKTFVHAHKKMACLPLTRICYDLSSKASWMSLGSFNYQTIQPYQGLDFSPSQTRPGVGCGTYKA
ncbi:hypothetical protein VTN96DRAFT_255 [Rasamsonia emersonii]